MSTFNPQVGDACNWAIWTDVEPCTVVARTATTCNARDFYPQEPGAWQRARAERDEMFRLLHQVCEYALAWELRAAEHNRSR